MDRQLIFPLACLLAIAIASAPATAEVAPANYLPLVSSPDSFGAATPQKMIDGSGLSEPGMALPGAQVGNLLPLTHVFGNSYLSSWVTAAPILADYFSTAPAPVLVFDLGGDVALNSMVFWQYENDGGAPGRSGNAARTIELRFSPEADGPMFPAAAWGTVTLQNVELGLGGVNSAQHFGIGVSARYVQLRVTDNYFGYPGITAGGDRVGIGELRFNVDGGSGRTLVGGAPNVFELRSATVAPPSVAPIATNINPWGLALDPENERIIWSDPVSGKVGWTGYGSNAGAEATLFQLNTRVWHGIDLDCEARKLYLLDSAMDDVMCFDLATNQLTTAFSTAPFVRPNAIDHDPQTGLLAITDSGTDTVYLYDTAGALQSSYNNTALSTGVWGVAADPLSDGIFVTSHDLGTLSLWHPGNGQFETITSGLNKPRGVEVDRIGRVYCLLSGDGQIVEIDRSTGDVTPGGIGLAPGGRDLVIFDAEDTDGDALLDWWEVDEGYLLCELAAGSDPESDALDALAEMLFNGSTSAAEGNFGSLLELGGGVKQFSFETLADEAYGFRLMLSDDLNNWQPASAAPVLSPLGGGNYDLREYFIDPVAEGFPNDVRIFGRLEGGLVAP